MLTVMDVCIKERMANSADCPAKSCDVTESLAELTMIRAAPDHGRCNIRPESSAKAVRGWLRRLGARTPYIEPGPPWERGCIENFNGKLRDELLDREVFCTLQDVGVLAEQ